MAVAAVRSSLLIASVFTVKQEAGSSAESEVGGEGVAV